MKSILFLHWAPRILAIVAILFISVFSLDAFQPGVPLTHEILAWLMHMIPSFVLIIILVIAWKWENIGGIIFLSLGMAFTPFIFWGNYANNHSVWISLVVVLTITVPLILVGALFMMSYYTRRKAAEVLKMLDKSN
jgi:hypothetical protein